MSCVVECMFLCLPARKHILRVNIQHLVGNDLVSDKHRLARNASLAWAAAGKPSSGPEHWLMKNKKLTWGRRDLQFSTEIAVYLGNGAS